MALTGTSQAAMTRHLAKLPYLSIQVRPVACMIGPLSARWAGWRRGKLPTSRTPTTGSLITRIASTQRMETWVLCIWRSPLQPRSRSCIKSNRSDSSTHRSIKSMVNSMIWRCKWCLMTHMVYLLGANRIKAAFPSFSTWTRPLSPHKAPSGTGSEKTHFRLTWTKFLAKLAVWTLRFWATWAQRLSLIVWTYFAGTWTYPQVKFCKRH